MKTSSFVVALCGHDQNKIYVIKEIQGEYVYLVDGRIRTLDRPKKKKCKHVRSLTERDLDLSLKFTENKIKNEDIKRAIKLLKHKQK